MVHKRYIKRNGKIYGPYAYHSRRVGGKVISEYRGKDLCSVNKKNRFDYLFFVFILATFLFTGFSLIDNSDSFTFFSDLDFDSIKTMTGFVVSEEIDVTENKSETQTEIPDEEIVEEVIEIIPNETIISDQMELDEVSSNDSQTNETNETILDIEENITVENDTVITENVTNNALELENKTVVNETISEVEENILTINETIIGLNVSETNETKLNVTNNKTEEINVTANISVETVQFQAVIGQPVKWKKTISLNKTEKVKISLPKESRNIVVKKIKNKKKDDITSSSKITGAVISSGEGNFLFRLFEKLFEKLTITGKVISTEQTAEGVEVIIDENATEFEITYETPGPSSIETKTEKGKEIFVTSEIHFENILAFTNLSEEIADVKEIRLFEELNNTQVPVDFVSYDKNNNSLIDYIEWIVPSLSNRTYSLIIEISWALHLDENRTLISEITDEVKYLDGNWSEIINENEFVRVNFEQILDSSKDITIFPRGSATSVEVYEVNETTLLATFDNIIVNETNKIYLTELGNRTQDIFDLKILGGSFEFDWIVDPSPSVSANTTDTDVTQCGFINVSGTYAMTGDLSITGFSNHCLTIDVSNVNLDCQNNNIDSDDSSSSYGIFADGASGAELTNISISNCNITDFFYGINFDFINYSVIENVTANSNGNGIFFSDVNSSNLTNITTNSNTASGIFIANSNSSNLINITSNSNDIYGIQFSANSNSNILTNSTIENNPSGGVFLFLSNPDSPNLFYNNLLNNSNNILFVVSEYPGNWNTTLQTGTRIYSSGTQIGGNYYTNSTGGFSDTCVDFDGNGFCDKGFNISTEEACTLGTDECNTNFDSLALSDEFDVDVPNITFVDPTPPNNTFTVNTSVEINISINELHLDEVKFNWNGTNYSLYNDSLILMMNFDNVSALGENDTHVVDMSKYGNTGTVISATVNTTNCKYGNCFTFDGVGDSINISDSNSLDITNQVSISFWIKDENQGEDTGYISKEDSSATEWGIEDDRFYIWTSGTDVDLGIDDIDDNQWHHMTYVYDGFDAFVYKDGSLFNNTSTPSGSITSGDDLLTIGKTRISGNGIRYTNGSIDEVRIWNRSLSADEIQQQYFSNLKKYDTDKWYLYVNESYGEPLDSTTYTYFASAKDTTGNENLTETRFLNVNAIYPQIQFVNNTPANDTTTTNTSVEINATIIEANLNEVKFNWDGTNYTLNDLSVTSGLKLWVKADSGVINDSLNKTSTWHDQSGNENDFTQTTSSQQPIYTINALNGKPALRMTAASNQTMSVSTNFPAPVTIIYVGKLNGGANARLLSGKANNWLLGFWNGAKNQGFFEGWVSASGTPAADRNPYIYSAIIPGSGSNSEIYENGNRIYENQGGVTGPNGLCLSGHLCTSEFSNADIAEIIVYNRTLNNLERESVEGYLAVKYNLQNSLLNSSYKFFNLTQFNSTQWYLYVNESYDEPLGNITYTYFASAKDTTGNGNLTETRFLNVNAIYPQIQFVNNTPANDTTTTNTSVEINATIIEANLNEVKFNWDGTNYTMYNDSLYLMINFDNVSSLGDNSTNFVDVSNYSNNGTCSGTNCPVYNLINKRYGNSSVTFDGVDDYVNLSTSAEADTLETVFSVEAWFKSEDIAGNSLARIITRDCSDYWCIAVKQDQAFPQNLTVYYEDNAYITITDVVNQNIWHHVIVVWDGSNANIYLDGALKASPAFTNFLATSRPVIMGDNTEASPNPGVSPFNGSIDELRIWNRSLSADEVTQQYMSNLRKYDTDKWNLYVNQSKNSTDGLDDGTYTYFSSAKDNVGNENLTETRYFTVDTTNPQINFVSPTNNSGVFVSRNYIEINVLVTDDNIDTITINLYNSTSDIIQTNTSSTSPFYINYTGLSDGLYYYNSTANDTLGQTNSTETRNINLDVIFPNITILSPTNGTTYNTDLVDLNWTIVEQNLDWCAYSLDGGSNDSSICPKNPTRTGSLSNNWLDSAQGVFVSEDYMYVTGSVNDSINIFNITNKSNPTRISSLVETGNNPAGWLNGAKGVYVSGNYAYVVSLVNDSINIINITNKSNPTRTGSLVKTGAGLDGWLKTPSYVFVQGDYAYVTTANNRSINIIDVSDKTNPIWVSGITDLTWLNAPVGVFVSGNYTYLASDYNDSINIINVTDKTNPVRVGSLTSDWFDSAKDVFVQGDYAYVTSLGNDSISVINVTNKSNPIRISSLSSDWLNGASGVFVQGDYAYVSTSFNHSINIIDVSDKSNLIIVDSLVETGTASSGWLNYANEIFVQGDYAYVAASTNDSINIFDVSLSPKNITLMSLSDSSHNVTIYANDTAGNLKQSDYVYFSVDTLIPNITFVDPTNSSGVTVGRDYVEINVSITDENLDTITINLYNSTNDLIQTNTSLTNPFYINYSSLSDGLYYYNSTVNDSAGQINQTETRSITLDSTSPLTDFVDPTNDSGVIASKNYIEINVTATDENLANITIRLYNSTNDLINSSVTGSSPNYINFSNLTEGIYYYNATANDTFGNENQTETRNITLDTTSPNMTSFYPNSTGGISYEESFQINVSIVEPNDQAFNFTFTNGSVSLVEWFVDGAEQISYENLTQFTWIGSYSQEGEYLIKANVSTFAGNDSQNWSLTVNNTVQSSSPGSPGGGGGSSGGGGGAACIYDWVCTEWYPQPCSENGIQEKLCVNKGTCNGTLGMPDQTRDCVYVESTGPLFDLFANVPYAKKWILLGESILAEIELINVGDIQELDVFFKYWIVDENNKLISEKQDTRAIKERDKFDLEFLLPNDLQLGLYKLFVEINYDDGKTALAEDSFKIVEKKPLIFRGLGIALGAVFLILGIVSYMIYRSFRPKFSSV